jgi:hypothetical protein
MLLTFAWILLIPILYPLYYSDFRNRFPDDNRKDDIQKFKIRAFLLAATGFIGLAAYIMVCFIIMFITILKESNLVNPFKIFPFCSLGE